MLNFLLSSVTFIPKLFCIYSISQFTEWLRLEGTSGGHPDQPPCSSTATYSWLPKTMSWWLLSISSARDSTTSLATCSSAQPPSHYRKQSRGEGSPGAAQGTIRPLCGKGTSLAHVWSSAGYKFRAFLSNETMDNSMNH